MRVDGGLRQPWRLLCRRHQEVYCVALAASRRTALHAIAQAAAWLLSDRFCYVTGTVLRVDGGARV